MADMTLIEAEAQLVQVNIAIQDIIMGKAISELKVGSGEFSRWYKFQDVTLDNLCSYRTELRNIINALTPSAIPLFRTNACIPIITRKC
jgi:hypothetical protein